MQALFEYLYAFDYNVPESDQWADAEFHTEMCILAHKVGTAFRQVTNIARAGLTDTTVRDLRPEEARNQEFRARSEERGYDQRRVS